MSEQKTVLVILLSILAVLLFGVAFASSSTTTTITTTTTTITPKPPATPTSQPVKKTTTPVATPVAPAPKPVVQPPKPAPVASTPQRPAVDLRQASELGGGGYNRSSWSKSWNRTVNSYLGWGTGSCRYAFYETSGNCHTRNHRDHLVPLREAYDSGGYNWTTSRKKQFYTYLPNLYEMLGRANSSKGSRDPAEWKPYNRSSWCRYATEWIAVKKYWQLSADIAEINALKEMLATCT